MRLCRMPRGFGCYSSHDIRFVSVDVVVPLSLSIMSLLQGVLRSNVADMSTLDKKLKAMNILPSTSTVSDKDDSDDDLINVVSAASPKLALNTNQYRSLFLERRIALDHRHQFEVPQPDHFVGRCIFHPGGILSRRFPPKYRKESSLAFPYVISQSVHSFRGNGARAKPSTTVRSSPSIPPQGAHHCLSLVSAL